ncbi:MAG: ABC transporter ATP-binding protein [Clostridia bacterium]|nr:ABC transporter ATP-binding protein [Clostridia bacterium]
MSEQKVYTTNPNAKRLQLIDLEKVYPNKHGADVHAVDRINMDIAPGEFVTLLGPSGCGKTTTLRMIAGFEKPTGGDIRLGGESIRYLSPDRRDTAMVFQTYALFPNLNVYDNIAYGLKIKKLTRQEIQEKVMGILNLTGLMGLENRHTNELSGGQQQRVALARALVMEPGILLFDEPLSNLDAKLRIQMRTEIRKIQRAVGITAVYVTHDQAEAMSMSDRIVILKDGRIEQMGSPKEVYYSPVSEFSANFIGTANMLHGKVVGKQDDGISVSVLDMEISGIKTDREFVVGDECTLVIRPEACTVQEKGLLSAKVVFSTFMGSYQLYELEVGGNRFTVHENNPKNQHIYETGETARIELDVADIHAI